MSAPVDRVIARNHLESRRVETSQRLREEGEISVETGASVHFEENGSELTAVEVGQTGRSPVIARLHRVLFALGVVVSTYQVRALSGGIVERIVIQRRDGGAVTGELGARTRAAVLPIALDSGA